MIKYQRQIKDDREESIKKNIEQYLALNSIEKTDLILGHNPDKMLRSLIDIEENIGEVNIETKAKILELSSLDSSFIQKCKYFKTAYLYSIGELNGEDIKYRISESIMKNKDDLAFYTYLTECVTEKIAHAYDIKVLKNKKFKYILEKCGYKQENGTNYYMAGNRSICIDINVLEYYKFII